MKETGDSNAPYFGLPEGLNGVRPHAKPFYGKTNVPHPINSAAKVVPESKVMSEVLHAK